AAEPSQIDRRPRPRQPDDRREAQALNLLQNGQFDYRQRSQGPRRREITSRLIDAPPQPRSNQPGFSFSSHGGIRIAKSGEWVTMTAEGTANEIHSLADISAILRWN